MTTSDKTKNLRDLWWVLPTLAPLILIAVSYAVAEWSWGLMDDLQLLETPGSVWERTKQIFGMYYGFGELKWTHAFHTAVTYRWFADSPQMFHVFKMAEVILMLLIWGLAARDLTGSRRALFLVPSIALSFHYLYDQFFFLSSHETTGLLFLGLAVWAFVKSETAGGAQPGRRTAGLRIAGALMLLLSVGAKETFLAGILGTGMWCLLIGWKTKKPQTVWLGLGIALAAVAHGLFLKFVVSGNYTSGYSFTDFPRIGWNFSQWALKDFLNHLPWIVAAGAILFVTRHGEDQNIRPRERMGMVLGLGLYVLFLGLLLPWNATSYYAGPLGVFFAFAAASLLARRTEKLSPQAAALFVLAAVTFNLVVGGYSLQREGGYHRDTQQLWSWIRHNTEFQKATRDGLVLCNAHEASDAIPGHANRFWGLDLKSFRYAPVLPAISSEKYFVHTPRFGTPHPQFAEWPKVFASKYWTVYRIKGPRT